MVVGKRRCHWHKTLEKLLLEFKGLWLAVGQGGGRHIWRSSHHLSAKKGVKFADSGTILEGPATAFSSNCSYPTQLKP